MQDDYVLLNNSTTADHDVCAIRPVDDSPLAEVLPDWYKVLNEGSDLALNPIKDLNVSLP